MGDDRGSTVNIETTVVFVRHGADEASIVERSASNIEQDNAVEKKPARERTKCLHPLRP